MITLASWAEKRIFFFWKGRFQNDFHTLSLLPPHPPLWPQGQTKAWINTKRGQHNSVWTVSLRLKPIPFLPSPVLPLRSDPSHILSYYSSLLTSRPPSGLASLWSFPFSTLKPEHLIKKRSLTSSPTAYRRKSSSLSIAYRAFHDLAPAYLSSFISHHSLALYFMLWSSPPRLPKFPATYHATPLDWVELPELFPLGNAYSSFRIQLRHRFSKKPLFNFSSAAFPPAHFVLNTFWAFL